VLVCNGILGVGWVDILVMVSGMMYSGHFWKNKTLKNQKWGPGMQTLDNWALLTV
jgi:hypothetical protein